MEVLSPSQTTTTLSSCYFPLINQMTQQNQSEVAQELFATAATSIEHKFCDQTCNMDISEKIPESPFHFESCCVVLPHPNKVAKGGEDAYFTTPLVVGVADGVGGWADVGIDPALYARKLAEGAKLCVDTTNALDPLLVLQSAYDHSKEVQGSSTACIVSLEGKQLNSANLGDSGFMVIRGNKIIFRTKEQQYAFNFPFQLGTNSDCRAENADFLSLEVQDGDLVILVPGTDGLFDNLFDEDILELVTSSPDDQLSTIAERIATRAREVSLAWYVPTPFSKAAVNAGYPFFLGGKLDDITVLANRVVGGHRQLFACASVSGVSSSASPCREMNKTIGTLS